VKTKSSPFGKNGQVETLGNVKLGLLHDLHLSNHAILEREDRLAMFFDLLSDHFRDQLFHLRKKPMEKATNKHSPGKFRLSHSVWKKKHTWDPIVTGSQNLDVQSFFKIKKK